MANIRIKRGTRAQLEAAKAASGLAAGEPYLITDEGTMAVGTAVNDYAVMSTGTSSSPEIAADYFERGTTRPAVKGKTVASERLTITTPRYIMHVGDTTAPIAIPATELRLDMNSLTTWDDTSFSYHLPSSRAGKDFYIYALKDTTRIVISANSTVPTGYTSTNSRKIGGFHCLCLSVGTIGGHALTGFLTGDILPASVWDLRFRPASNPEGMVYVQPINKWVDIYRSDSSGLSIFGATALTGYQWITSVNCLLAANKILPSSLEFWEFARGSNESTNVAGSAAKSTTGGWTDTNGRRMISDYGAEDCCGVSSQWLRDPSYQNNSSTYSGTFSWVSKQYGQGSYIGTMQTAGGDWNDGANCGSYCRKYFHRWGDATIFSCSIRGVANSINL